MAIACHGPPRAEFPPGCLENQLQKPGITSKDEWSTLPSISVASQSTEPQPVFCSARYFTIPSLHRFAQYDMNNENLHGDYYEVITSDKSITWKMFQWMRMYDQTTDLCYNDYNVVSGGLYNMVSNNTQNPSGWLNRWIILWIRILAGLQIPSKESPKLQHPSQLSWNPRTLGC